MHINDVDDYPFHQHPGMFHVGATSDSHLNDGYWFAAFTDDVFAFMGLRLYPNMNVIDGYAGVVHRGEQRNVRASRLLTPTLSDLSVGPFALHVLEPMKRQRLVLGPNPTGVELDVEITATAPPVLEAPHVQHRAGRLINHVQRYAQCGDTDGWVTVDDERFDLAGGRACRDHSWGVRASMGAHVPIGGRREPSDEDRRALRLWAPFDVPGLRGFVQTHEDADGTCLDLEGVTETPDGEPVPVRALEHHFVYEPGSRRLRSGRVVLRGADDAEHVLEFDVVHPPAHVQGFGYRRGWSDGQPPGSYRGPLHVEHDRFDVSDPTHEAGPAHVPQGSRTGGMEYVVTMSADGGERRLTQIEHNVYRSYPRYGIVVGEKESA